MQLSMLIGKGYGDGEIASRLGRSVRAVAIHRAALMKRADAADRLPANLRLNTRAVKVDPDTLRLHFVGDPTLFARVFGEDRGLLKKGLDSLPPKAGAPGLSKFEKQLVRVVYAQLKKLEPAKEDYLRQRVADLLHISEPKVRAILYDEK